MCVSQHRVRKADYIRVPHPSGGLNGYPLSDNGRVRGTPRVLHYRRRTRSIIGYYSARGTIWVLSLWVLCAEIVDVFL